MVVQGSGGGAVVSPPDMDSRWAQPRPPAEKARLQGYPRNAGVPSLNLKPILADKFAQRNVVLADLQDRQERPLPKELPKLDRPPNSAREPAAKAPKPPKQGSQTARGRVEGSHSRHDNSTAFLRLLVELGDSVLDDKNLQRLEAHVGSSKQTELLQFLKQAYQELSSDKFGVVSSLDDSASLGHSDATSLELHQLTAQAAFLEKKILKLREKLKRQARESSLPPDQAEADQLERLEAEVEGLRTQKALLLTEKEAVQRSLATSSSAGRLPSPGGRGRSPSREPSPRPKDEAKDATQAKTTLQKRLQHLQTQMKERIAEKDAADRNAEEARKLAENVEQRLRDMLVTRESERVKLEAEQELLRRRVQEQERQLQELEGGLGDFQELNLLRERVAEIEQELHGARQRRADLAAKLQQQQQEQQSRAPKARSRTREPPGQSPQIVLADRAGAASAEERPETSTSSMPATATRPSTDGAAAEDAGADMVGLAPPPDGDASPAPSQCLGPEAEQLKVRLADLEKELQEAQAAAEQSREQCRQQLDEDLDKRRAELAEELKECESAVTNAANEKEFLKEVQAGVEKLAARQELELSDLRRSADDRIAAVEEELQAAKVDVAKDRHQGEIVARRQNEICGRCFLALWPVDYRREEVLHFLCCALGMQSQQMEVVEECCIAAGIPCAEIFTAEPQPMAAAGTFAAEEFEQGDPYLIRLTLVLHALHDPRSEQEQRRAEQVALVQQLLELVRHGGSLLEDIAVVGANYLRGTSALDAEGEKWNEEASEFVSVVSRDIGDRTMHIKVHMHTEPLVVRVTAIEHAKDEEYTICFDDNDLAALLGEASLLRRRLEMRSIDLLLDTLTVVDGPHGEPILTALQVVQAPQTVLNGLPSGELALAMSLRGQGESQAQADEMPAGSVLQAPLESFKASDVVTNAESGRAMFEDVLTLADTFFTLSVFEDVFTRTLRVRLQESSCCEAVEAILPGRTDGAKELRQLRMHAEAYEFKGMNVLLLVEDLDVPPGLLIRVADGGSVFSKEVHTAADHCVYHLVQVTDDDGALSYLPEPVARQGAVVSTIQAQHREHLRMFAESDLPLNTKKWNQKALPMIGHQELATEGDATLLQIADAEAVTAASAKTLKAVKASKRLEAIAEDGGRLLLKIGKRVEVHRAGGDSKSASSSSSSLCVLTFVEKSSPILHLSLFAHQLGTCQSWFLPVDSLTVFRVLGDRLPTGASDLARRRALAASLVDHCVLVPAGPSEPAGSLTLALSGVEAESSAVAAGDAASGADATPGGLAHQAISQEEAALWVTEEMAFCVAAAPLHLGSGPVEVLIYDDPGAETAPFSLNNFLVLAHDAHRGIYFSLRLHDRTLAYPLQEQEHHLLELEHKTDLLRRVLASIDLCNSVDQNGKAGEHLVMQQEILRDIPPLRPDGAGVLHPAGLHQDHQEGEAVSMGLLWDAEADPDVDFAAHVEAKFQEVGQD